MSHPERIVPDETERGIVALHLKRYAFARPACAGKRVLDAGCGVGYGSAFLAEAAAHVTGIDASEGAVAYARRRYALANVEFRVGDLTALEAPDGSYDVVCMFEVIEHLANRGPALTEVARVLRRDGVFFVSTPRADVTTETPANPFHHVEYSQSDFTALLSGTFADVTLYGQRRLQTRRHRLARRLDVLGLRHRLPAPPSARRVLGSAPTAELEPDDIVITQVGIARATELVAVCRRPLIA